jgi:hypothetical protein
MTGLHRCAHTSAKICFQCADEATCACGHRRRDHFGDEGP